MCKICTKMVTYLLFKLVVTTATFKLCLLTKSVSKEIIDLYDISTKVDYINMGITTLLIYVDIIT